MARKVQWSEESLILGGLALGIVYLLLAVLPTQLYFVVDAPTYQMLHTVLELASILVSFSIFVVNWEASKQSHNGQSLFVATGFLAVASLDTMHLLSYPGMPDFLTANGLEKAVFYWLSARLWAAVILLGAVFVRPSARAWFLRRRVLLGVNGLVAVVVLAAVTFFPERLPDVFVEGQGLTDTKVYLEYLVITLSFAALLGHLRGYRRRRDEYSAVVGAALVVSIFSELAFTLYISFYDVYNLVGHFYKLVAYYLIFRALMVSSLRRPYELLRVAKERMERTVAELDARNRELDALDDVAMTLSSTLRPDEMLHAAVGKIMKVMKAGSGAIYLRDENSDRLRLSVWRNLPQQVVEGIMASPVCLPHPNSIPFGPSRLATGPGALSQERNLGGSAAVTAPLGSCACAPIVSKGSLLGMVAMVSPGDSRFTVRDTDLLTAIGYQLGLAIENTRLYESTDERLREKLQELQEAERRARFLAEVGALFGSSMELEKVLDLVARNTTEVLGDWCAIYLLDERDHLLRLAAAYHTDEDELKAIRQVLSGRPLPQDEGLIGRVARTGEPALEQETARAELALESQYLATTVDEIAILQQVIPTSRIAVPMRARGRTVGVLSIMVTHAHRHLGEADLSLALEVADRAGGAIDNSLLFEDSQSQRQHLEAVISQMVDGVVIADPSGHILAANVAARQMLGERTQQLLGQESHPSESLSRGLGRVRVFRLPMLTRALKGELVVGEEISVGGDSSGRILSGSASPVRDEGGIGEITGAVAVLRDVTAEREVERLKEEFMATVSHELRTPITAVMGYTDILLRGLRGPLQPKQTEALTSIRAASNRLLMLINDLLDMSRLEAGKQLLRLRPVDLSHAVEATLSGIAVIAAGRRIQISTSFASNLPFVLADDEQLGRILGNLISNAVKFTPEGGEVKVSAYLSTDPRGGNGSAGQPADSEQCVMVTVSDNGIGIPREKHEGIWEKFQQVDGSSRRSYGGTGLGLAITKGLVTLHGGKVWVESEGVLGKGSTFGFSIPVARPGGWWTRQLEDQSEGAAPSAS